MIHLTKKTLNVLTSRWVLGVIAIVSLVGLFRPDWFFQVKSDVQVEIISTAPIFDVRAPLGKLGISYDGKDITSSGGSIISVTLQVVNRGRASVRKTDFDESFPLGLEISGGTLLERPALKPSNEYLEKSLKIVRETSTSIFFSPVILDANDYFTISFLLLIQKDRTFAVSSTGKIAGHSTIPVLDLSVSAAKKPFWSEVTEGSPRVHVTRALLYVLTLFAGIFGVVLSMFVILSIVSAPFDVLHRATDRAQRPNRIDTVNRYLRERSLPFTPIRSLILTAYVDQNVGDETIYDYLLDLNEGKLTITNAEIAEVTDKTEKIEASRNIERMRKLIPYRHLRGLWKRLGEPPAADFEAVIQDFKKELADFVAFLRERGIPVRISKAEYTGPQIFYPAQFREPNFEWAAAQARRGTA
jgi:hypothetical protein